MTSSPAARRASPDHAPARLLRGPIIQPGTSPYGQWVLRDRLPAFAYAADHDALPAAEWDPVIGPRTRRHWLMVGNRAVRMQAANDGTVALFDEGDGLRWLVAPDPVGTGVSILDDGGTLWGTEWALRAGEAPPVRTFGPTWFEVRDARAGLALERTLLCPEGEVPWLLVRVRLALSRDAAAARTLLHIERWALGPRFLNLFETVDQRRARAELGVAYQVGRAGRGVTAAERFATGAPAAFLIGPPATLVLEPLGRTAGAPGHRLEDSPHPILEIETPLVLAPGESRELWFRFGRQDDRPVGNPRALLHASLRRLSKRLPRAAAPAASEAATEIPWHAALLTGGLAVDRVIGGHTLDQASAYAYVMGFNGAARDPLQHALPLVYIEPELGARRPGAGPVVAPA